MEPVSYAAIEEDGTSGLVIEVFDDLDKVGADVVLLHGCPQSCMPNPVGGLLEVYEDMVEDLLVLEIFLTEIFLTEDSQVEDPLCGALSYSEACLFFSVDLLCLWLQSVQYIKVQNMSNCSVALGVFVKATTLTLGCQL